MGSSPSTAAFPMHNTASATGSSKFPPPVPFAALPPLSASQLFDSMSLDATGLGSTLHQIDTSLIEGNALTDGPVHTTGWPPSKGKAEGTPKKKKKEKTKTKKAKAKKSKAKGDSGANAGSTDTFVLVDVTSFESRSDGFRWRKYGQKDVKGSPYARSYYRCTTDKCPARKYVEKHVEDPSKYKITYKKQHTHARPDEPQKDSAKSAAAAASKQTPLKDIMATVGPTRIDDSTLLAPWLAYDDGYSWVTVSAPGTDASVGDATAAGAVTYMACAQSGCPASKDVVMSGNAYLHKYKGIHNHEAPFVEASKGVRHTGQVINRNQVTGVKRSADEMEGNGHQHAAAAAGPSIALLPPATHVFDNDAGNSEVSAASAAFLNSQLSPTANDTSGASSFQHGGVNTHLAPGHAHGTGAPPAASVGSTSPNVNVGVAGSTVAAAASQHVNRGSPVLQAIAEAASEATGQLSPHHHHHAHAHVNTHVPAHSPPLATDYTAAASPAAAQAHVPAAAAAVAAHGHVQEVQTHAASTATAYNSAPAPAPEASTFHSQQHTPSMQQTLQPSLANLPEVVSGLPQSLHPTQLDAADSVAVSGAAEAVVNTVPPPAKRQKLE